MNELKFNSQVCTTKIQSQRLLELGLKPETADMSYYKGEPCLDPYEEMECPYDKMVLPAWSMHRLMEILDAPLVEFYLLSYNPYEEIIYNVSECIKNGYISKKYLKQ
ncbi:MAG: hypothetical protein E7088_09280 [Bacteroidales bacterium]|nr:hypothetical protein [Bacteroidales bacterium]